MNAPVGVGVGAAVGNVDPTGAKLAGTGLKAVSGVAIAGAGSEDEGTGAQAVCSGVVCTGPGVGGTGAKSPCTGVNAPASVDATGGNVDPTGVKPATGLKAVSGADTVGFRSEDEGIGAQAACVGADAAGDAVGTFVPHPPQKTAVSFNAEPQLPQNLAIVFLLHGSSIPLVHLLADELPVYSRVNSTRRLRARPSRVSFVSMGCDAPNPFVDRRSAAM